MKYIGYIAKLHLLSIVIAFLNTMEMSGGEVAGYIFPWIAFTGVATILACILLFLFKFKTFWGEWHLVFLLFCLMLLGFGEAMLVDWETILRIAFE